jgi:hypothetical protein
MKTKVGLVTIGQSPREDVVGEIRKILGPGIEIIQKYNMMREQKERGSKE